MMESLPKGSGNLKGLFLAPVESKLGSRALAGYYPLICHNLPGPGEGASRGLQEFLQMGGAWQVVSGEVDQSLPKLSSVS